LEMAVLGGHLAVVQALLGSGADIHKTYGDGHTILMVAVGCDHLTVVETLLEAGADAKGVLNVLNDPHGFTALDLAVYSKRGAAMVAALQRHERSG